ncbi:hypothetical protein GKODMF_14085 [Candidatus Electrothrix gigas]
MKRNSLPQCCLTRTGDALFSYQFQKPLSCGSPCELPGQQPVNHPDKQDQEDKKQQNFSTVSRCLSYFLQRTKAAVQQSLQGPGLCQYALLFQPCTLLGKAFFRPCSIFPKLPSLDQGGCGQLEQIGMPVAPLPGQLLISWTQGREIFTPR